MARKEKAGSKQVVKAVEAGRNLETRTVFARAIGRSLLAFSLPVAAALSVAPGLAWAQAEGDISGDKVYFCTNNVSETDASFVWRSDLNAACGWVNRPDPCAGVGAPYLSIPTALEVRAGQTATLNFTTSADNGMVSPAPGKGSARMNFAGGTVTYTAQASASGSDSFGVFFSNGCVPATRTIAVTLLPAGPTVAPVSVSNANFNAPTSIALAVGGLWTNAAIVQSPVHGAVSLSGSTATYTPATDYYGADSFTYSATDGTQTAGPATVSITIPKPAAPGSAMMNVTVPYGLASDIPIVSSQGPMTGINLIKLPKVGNAEVRGTSIHYSPAPGYTGEDTLDVQLIGPGGSSIISVNLSIEPPPAPVAPQLTATTRPNTPVEIPVASTGGPYEGMGQVTAPQHGSLMLTYGKIIYTPDANYVGSDQFWYKIIGPGGQSQSFVRVSIERPAAPVAGGASLSTAYGTPLNVTIPATGEWDSVQIKTQARHGVVTVSGKAVVYTPEAGYYGPDSFTYVVTGPGGTGEANIGVETQMPPPPALTAAEVDTGFNSEVRFAIPNTGGPISGVALVQDPANGTASITASEIRFAPNAGFIGVATVQYRATGPGGTANGELKVNVKAPSAPTVPSIMANVGYGAAAQISLSATGYADTFAVAGQPAHGSVTVSGSTATYTPAEGYYGSDAFTYTASGPGGTSSPATVNVTVALPPAPSVAGGSLNVPFEGSAVFSASPTGVFTGLTVGAAAHGTTARVGGRAVRYTASPGYFGPDSFEIVVEGPGGVSASATVNVTVALPPPPVTPAVSATTAYLTAKSVVLAPQGVVADLTVAQPGHGHVELVGSTATYTPAAGFWGEDSFTYTASGPGGTTTGTITVQVALPPAPTAKAVSLSTPYGQAITGELRAEGVFDGFAIGSTPSHGTASIAGSEVSYTPEPTFYGSDSFTFTAHGPGGTSTVATVSVEVGLPGRPAATPATRPVGYNGAASVQLGGQGVYGSFAISTPPLHGAATLDGDILTYTPSPGYFGEDVVMFTVTGPGGTSAPAPITLEVAKPPAPTAGPVDASTAFKTPAEIQLAASGVFDAIEILQAPQHGTVAVAGSAATYTPAADYYGPDAFTYVAKGPGGVSAVAQVKVSVGLPPAPTVSGMTLSTAFGESVSRKLTGAGVLTRYVVTKQPPHGVATIDGDVLLYRPNGGFYGDEAFSYAAEGPGGLSQAATVTVAVGLPGSPALNGDELVVQLGQPATLRLRPIGVVDSYEVTMSPSSGSISISGDDVTYKPVPGFAGRDSFAVRAVGPGGKSDAATFTVTVQAAAPPEIKVSAPEIQIATDGSGLTQIVPQGAVDDILIVEQPKNGKVEVVRIAASPASVALLAAEIPETLAASYTPNKGFQGRDNFVLAAKGPGGVSQPVRISVKVGAVPPPILPEGTPDEAETVTGRPVRIEVLANDKNATKARLGSPASHGTVVSDGSAFIYTPEKGYNGPDAFTYAAVNDDGESAQITVRIMVLGGDLPSVVSHAVTSWAGKAVVVDLTEGATGGPFLSGRIESVSNGRAGVFALRDQGGKIELTFTPYGAFAGKVSVRYVLTNRFGDSQPGEVALTVKERPDPAVTGDMSGLVAAAGEAAARFSQTQSANAFRRMESLHDGASPRASLGLGLPIDNGERAPGRDPSRDAMGAELEAATAPKRQTADTSPYGRIEAPHVGLWAGGAFDLGHRNANQTIARRKFETSGLTVGLDRRLNGVLAAGLAVGFGRDRSEIGAVGSRLSATQVSGLGYATMQFAEHGFLDLVGGYGRLDYKTLRRVEEIGKTLEGQQDGSAIFGATSLGWAIERRALGFSPYARVQYLRADLKAYSETGDDTFALKVGGRKVEDLSVVAGSRMWLERAMRKGVLRPQVRIEYRQTVKGAGSARLQYADWLDGPVYEVKARAFENRSADLGLGLSWRSIVGGSAEVEYQTDLLADGQMGRVSLRVSTPF